MRKLGLMWKTGVSFLLALSFLLLLTSSFIGCGGSSPTTAPAAGSATPAFSTETQTAFKAAVDAAFNDVSVTNKRGISVAVYKDGYQMWTYAAGFADGVYGTATGTAMTTSTPSYAYSITKTLISALVLTQIENGLYSLDDTVENLLGSNADYIALSAPQKARIRTTATVAELLKHTSGMLDYAENIDALIPMCDPSYALYTSPWKPADIIEYIVDQDLVAGSGPFAFNYSNTNYILLGMIAQEMSVGKLPLNTLLANTFFSPLGVTAILAPQDNYPSVIAHGYDDAWTLGWPAHTFMDFDAALKAYVNSTYDFFLGVGRGTWAAGGIVATAANLAKWGHELYDPDGSAITAHVRAILKNSALNDGDYGYGVNYDDFTYTDGTIGGEYSHGGGGPGYRTVLLYEKVKGITVAIMTNVNNYGGAPGNIVPVYTLAEAILNAYQE
jgi:CubicO group peptidase (beta-lactamase class C family)